MCITAAAVVASQVQTTECSNCVVSAAANKRTNERVAPRKKNTHTNKWKPSEFRNNM